MRILLLNRNRIGDVLFTTPAIAALRERFPDAFLVNVVHPACLEIFKANTRPDITVGRPVRGLGNQLDFVRQLREWQFDQAVIFSRSSIGIAVLGRVVAPRLWGLDGCPISRLLTDRVPQSKGQHMVDDRLDLVRALGAESPNPRMEMPQAPEDQAEADRILAEAGWKAGEVLFGFSPGASTEDKRWPWERFAEVARSVFREFGARTLIVGGRGDIERASEIASMVRPTPVVAAGRTGLAVSGALIARCAVFAAGDTGPLHIAAAVGTPAVGIYGPTNPVRSGIYRGHGIAVRPDATDHPPTIDEVPVEMVLDAVRALFARTPADAPVSIG